MKALKILCLVISVVLLFSACSFGGSTVDETTTEETAKNEIQLTTENASQYLTFELHGYPTNYSSSYYTGVVVNGTISGIAGYTYNNVTVTIDVTFSYNNYDDYSLDDETYKVTTSSQLNLGGSGTVAYEEEYTGNHMTDVNCLGYTITSVTGTVSQN